MRKINGKFNSWYINKVNKIDLIKPHECIRCRSRIYIQHVLFEARFHKNCHIKFQYYEITRNGGNNIAIQTIMKFHSQWLKTFRKIRKLWENNIVVFLCCFCFDRLKEKDLINFIKKE